MENNRGPKVHTNYNIAPPSSKKLGFLGPNVHTNYNIAPPSSKKPGFFGSFASLSPWDVASLFVK